MGKNKKSRYTPAPEVPPEVAPLYAAVLSVLSGQTTVADAARGLDTPRNHFQTMMHRGLLGMLEAMQPRPSGRAPAKSERERELEQENERLRRNNERLEQRVATIERLLGVAGEYLRGRSARGRSKTTAARPAEARHDDADSDPDGDDRRRALAVVRGLRELGLRAELAAAVAGHGPSTVRTWAQRERAGELLAAAPGPRSCALPDPELERAAEAVVRELNGVIGAAPLHHEVPELSRRQAQRVLIRVRRELERERRAGCDRVVVTAPGVLRGMDGVHVKWHGQVEWALISADGSVPFRTSCLVDRHYDERAVVHALEQDWALWGVPLVQRMDRASAHRTPLVRALCASEGVLMLHGEPRYPCFYGQLERQNREHRAWLDACAANDNRPLDVAAGAMLRAWNEVYPRRILGWRTAKEVWDARPPMRIDRDHLREQVAAARASVRNQDGARGASADTIERLAIERTLTNMGLLRRVKGGWC